MIIGTKSSQVISNWGLRPCIIQDLKHSFTSMVWTHRLDLRSVTSILIKMKTLSSLDLCAHCGDRRHSKGQASHAEPFLCLVDLLFEEVCWFLLEGLLAQVCLI